MPSKTAQLETRIQALEAENLSLKERIDFLEGIPALRTGIKGETLISQMVGGHMTIHTAPQDVITSKGIRIEVKFSRLNIPNIGGGCRRWSWNEPLGRKEKKAYDSLLLIGVADPRYRDRYRDPSSPYVIFDVPRGHIDRLNQQGNHISITTDPNRGGSGTRVELFKKFQITTSELAARYGLGGIQQP